MLITADKRIFWRKV